MAHSLFRHIFAFILLFLTISFWNTPTIYADECSSANVRWASSSNRIYIEAPVACTLSQIDASISQSAPLTLVDSSNKTWFLGANIILEDGARLNLHGNSVGGDVNELRIKSNNSSEANSTVYINAEWGTIDINSTKVTSWDESANTPDTEYSNFNRSYIYARSFLEGETPRISAININNSEVAYLGYNNPEAYGLSWKVMNSGLNINAEIKNSNIHHLYQIYLNGVAGAAISNNQITNNITDGLYFHGSADNILADNAIQNNGNYPIYLFSSNGNQLSGNTISGNTENYYYAKNNSVNSIINTDIIPLKVGDDTSSFNIENYENYIYQNIENIGTHTDNDKSFINFNSSIFSSVTTFDKLDFQIVPASGEAVVSPQIWQINGDYYKKWTVASSNVISADHVISRMKASTSYDVFINGVKWQTFNSDSSGNIEFTYDGGYTSTPATFEIIESGGTGGNPTDCTNSNIRYAASSNSIYLEGGTVTCTLTQMKALNPSLPITLVDEEEKIWFVGANLRVEDGATLLLHGSEIGGDVDWLRLKSNNVTNGFVFLRSDWGNLDIRNTKITSWDESANNVDTEYATNGRAYVGVRSRLAENGITANESRMDVVDSEIGYLGYYAAESYGLVWKVSGTPSADLFTKVDVLGDIINSKIHHNYFGTYMYGAFGMDIRENEVYSNIEYGFDPHDDSDSLVIEGNNVHDNGNHGIICSQRCDNLIIRNNISNNNDGNGIMLHRDANDSLVESNTLINNADSGIALFESRRNIVKGNLVDGGEKGIRLSVGSEENIIEDNELKNLSKYGIYFYKGSDSPVSGDGRPKFNIFRNNNIHDTEEYAVKLGEADDNTFENNIFIENGRQTYIEVKNGLRNKFIGNTITPNVEFKNREGSITTIENNPPIKLNVDSTSSFSLTDNAGRVFQLDEATIFTRITDASSSVTLNFENIGEATTAIIRNVSLSSPEDVDSKIVTWGTSKQFHVRKPTGGSVNVSYTVGDLNPGQTYVVRRGNFVIATLIANSQGKISFNNTISQASGTVLFSVQ